MFDLVRELRKLLFWRSCGEDLRQDGNECVSLSGIDSRAGTKFEFVGRTK